MTSTNERDEMRRVFFAAWRKYRENQWLEPLESMIIDIILLHPEYHELFDHPENISENNLNDSNPFLHVSLHLAIREQISINRPVGIKEIHEKLCQKFHDVHFVEHQMLECLGQVLWDAKEMGKLPDEQRYLEMLRGIE